MPNILAIETSTHICSVAIITDNLSVQQCSIAYTESHASDLHPLIEQCLNLCQLQFNQLSAIAVSIGPGSYTGLRIGLSSAKAFAYSLAIPIISIDTLAAMQYQAATDIANTIALLDARHNNCYLKHSNAPSCFFEINKNNVEQFADKNNIFVGVASALFLPFLPNATTIQHIAPSAESIALLAMKQFDNQLFDNLAYLEPNYIKPANITIKK